MPIANQLRLWFASMAYVLLCALRRIALHHTLFAKATCGTIRLATFLSTRRRLQLARVANSWRPIEHDSPLKSLACDQNEVVNF
jgi:hypothetical protein